MTSKICKEKGDKVKNRPLLYVPVLVETSPSLNDLLKMFTALNGLF